MYMYTGRHLKIYIFQSFRNIYDICTDVEKLRRTQSEKHPHVLMTSRGSTSWFDGRGLITLHDILTSSLQRNHGNSLRAIDATDLGQHCFK